MKKVKNAPLEASNVAVLLEHIPIGATRSVHSLQVKRVEADHYSLDGGPVIDLVDAIAQIGGYSGKRSNPLGFVEGALLGAGAMYGYGKATAKGTAAPAKASKAPTVRAPSVRLDYSPPKKGDKYVMPEGDEVPMRVRKMEDGRWFYWYDDQWIPTGSLMRVEDNRFYFSDGSNYPLLTTDPTKKSNPAPQAKWTDVQKEIAKQSGKVSNPAAKFERGKAVGGGHREERGYFYEVLNEKGKVVALTTSKAEAEDVALNPYTLKLPKGTYTFRHIGGKGSIQRERKI
jgi:hypothetical protein